jgi:hypothetical protein
MTLLRALLPPRLSGSRFLAQFHAHQTFPGREEQRQQLLQYCDILFFYVSILFFCLHILITM